MAAERLFRLLTARRPTWPLAFRFAGLASPLAVRAVPSAALADAHEAAGVPGVVAIALVSAETGARVFRSPAGALDLPEREGSALADEVSRALAIVCPVIGRCDHIAWHVRLCEGAKHPTNHTAARALGHSHDVVTGLAHVRVLDRPERYYGVPTRRLTDGHWLCYHAARAVYEEREARR